MVNDFLKNNSYSVETSWFFQRHICFLEKTLISSFKTILIIKCTVAEKNNWIIMFRVLLRNSSNPDFFVVAISENSVTQVTFDSNPTECQVDTVT